ncbi:hypothetical protein BX600DRAFT_437164 [Xylariales sp. PMI_506]|nr:hypothetical protein BX600DRAFT_437164 [Xylariales sp. PMI_506]
MPGPEGQGAIAPRRRASMHARLLDAVYCDRAVPACSQCIKYKWDCPEYPVPRPKTKRHRALRRSIRVLELINHLASGSRTGLHQLGMFMREIPPRLGASRALDDAVKCLCAGYVAAMSGDSLIHERYYSQAIGSLRRSLLNEDEALSEETLCASICLSWYEVLQGELSSPYLVYTTGTAKMIELRGPKRHRDGFGRTLLLGAHTLVTSRSLLEQEPCFLRESSWAAILDSALPGDCFRPDYTPGANFRRLDAMSAVQAELKYLLNGASDSTPDSFYTRALKLINKMNWLRSKFRQTLGIPDEDWVCLEEEERMGNLDDAVNAIVFCEDAIAYILIDLMLLDLRGELVSMMSSVAWMGEFVPELLYLLDADKDAGIIGRDLAESGILSQSWEVSINEEIEALFRLARAGYAQGNLDQPLGTRRLQRTSRVISLNLEKSGHELHNVRRRINALMSSDGSMKV